MSESAANDAKSGAALLGKVVAVPVQLLQSGTARLENTIGETRLAVATEARKLVTRASENAAVARLGAALQDVRRSVAARGDELNARADELRDAVAKRALDVRARTYAALGIASTEQIDKLTRKVNKLTKRTANGAE
jgi:hypothetical protein